MTPTLVVQVVDLDVPRESVADSPTMGETSVRVRHRDRTSARESPTERRATATRRQGGGHRLDALVPHDPRPNTHVHRAHPPRVLESLVLHGIVDVRTADRPRVMPNPETRDSDPWFQGFGPELRTGAYDFFSWEEWFGPNCVISRRMVGPRAFMSRPPMRRNTSGLVALTSDANSS